jgi:XRE family transcriptional regulator, regulator of sulfur utilization
MNIGNAVRLVREEMGFSQEKLSTESGISQTSISQIENGVTIPSKKTIAKICKALDVTEDVLYITGILEGDIPESRKKIVEQLLPKIKELAMQMMEERKQKLI